MVENLIDNTHEIISVSEINKRAKSMLEENFSFVWIEGEVSNFVSHSSGHWYFTLKDESSEIKCAMFSSNNSQIRFEPKNGDHLILNGTLSIFEGWGQYQIIVKHIELAGEGALLRAFEELKMKLQKEGLFDETIKKELPPYPKNIAVITSPDGAVIKDIINVLRRRSPYINITIIPTLVQGEKSAPLICEALVKVSRIQGFDLVILARGGGSIEDLWGFNDEKLAREIVRCSIPIISAVGHETDFTISDFVSDLRAPTPSIAAEIISQPYSELKENLENYYKIFCKNINELINQETHSTANLFKRLRHPGDKLRSISQTLDYLLNTLVQSINHEISIRRNNLKVNYFSLDQNSPKNKLKEVKNSLENTAKDLKRSLNLTTERKSKALIELVTTLEAVSPLSVLSRGYSIISTEPGGEIISDIDQVEVGEDISATLSKGKIQARITSKNKDEK